MHSNYKTILIIEDVDSVRKYLCLLLSEYGFEVLKARNGKEGLEICKTFHVDLVCTDVMMPVMDGIEFYKEVQKTLPGLKVVFTSGATLPPTLQKQIPDNSFIEKTFDLSALVVKLESFLGLELA
jgi:two-component system, OmpR family, response regulator